jgi:Magnesium chelatase, subunit ChlI
MLARRLTTILPAMTLADALETTRIHRVAGLPGDRTAVVTTRPFRAPHQTISDVGLIGGGQVPRPGDVSLAHHAILFLDELPEFRRHVLEVLRQPLEDGILCTRSCEHTRSGPVGDARGTGNAGGNRHGRVRVGPDLPQRAYGAWRVVSPRCMARFRRSRLTVPSTGTPKTISSPHDSLPSSQRAPGSHLIFA